MGVMHVMSHACSELHAQYISTAAADVLYEMDVVCGCYACNESRM